MKKVCILGTVMLLAISFISCMKQVEDCLLSEDESIVNGEQKIYSDKELYSRIEYIGSIDDLCQERPETKIRKLSVGYRVCYIGKKKFGIVFYNENGTKILGKICEMSVASSEFKNINVGNTLEDVYAIDTKGEYLFLHTGRKDTPRVSTHYTQDGYIITIEYNEENIVTLISKELI